MPISNLKIILCFSACTRDTSCITHTRVNSIRKQLDDRNINELRNNNIITYAGDSISDLLASCQADIGFIHYTS